MNVTPPAGLHTRPVSPRTVTLPHSDVLAGPRTVGWWGMLFLILSEATLFGALISTYFFLRANSPTWPAGGIDRPELLLAAINTVILLSSSWPMQMSVRSIRRGDRQGLKIGLAIALVLGVLFLSLQAVEYREATFTPQTNAYGSLFFTITGLHGLHVLIALVLAAFMLVRGVLGHFDARRYQAVENTALYWHFVDAVWIVIFVSLYLSPYLAS